MRTLIVLLSILAINGCGGGNSGTTSQTISLTVGQSYTVYPGDKLVKNGTDTVVKITHTQGNDASTVELLEGEASIIQK